MNVLSLTLRGMSTDTLTLLIEDASRAAGLVIMKQVTNTKQIGKSPALVLAEYMVMVANSEPGDQEA